ncbi:MAG TPA: type II secretion system protein N [Myxococcota bacterium]|nr:type II secretion system protein N [Myxococcota bacterium]
MAARSTRRTLPALLTLALLATLVAWALASAPGADLSADPDSVDVAAPPPAVLSRPPPPPAEEGDDPDAPETKLPLHLLATVVRENHALSLATIMDTERDTNEVLREGEHFEVHPEARIVRIERARVLIDRAGVREQLVITHREPSALGARETAEAPAKPLEESGKQARVPAPVLEHALGPGAQPEGDVSTVFENGKILGLRFDAIPAGGVYERIGLRNGDVVTDINGIPLADPSATAMVLAKFASAAVLDLWVRHGDGSRETLRVSPAAPNEVSPPANKASQNAVSEPAGSSDTGEPDEPDEDGE